VLVGHSMGGIYARIYERRYPADVVGLVLVDPAHEGDLFTMFQGRPVTIASLTADQVLQTVPAGDANVPLRQIQTGEPFSLLPDNLYMLRMALERRLSTMDAAKPVPHATIVEAVEGMRAALAELRQAGLTEGQWLGDRPLVVLTRGDGVRDAFLQLHETLAQTSTNGRHIVVAGAGHEIQLYQPAVVIQAVQDVLESVRTKGRLRER